MRAIAAAAGKRGTGPRPARVFAAGLAGACLAAALAGAGLATALAAAPATAVTAPGPGDFTDPDPAALQESISDLDANVTDLDMNVVDLEESITDVETTETSGSDSVITLATDILFDFDSAELGDAAVDRIAEIAADIPSGAVVAVEGHTDSKGEDSYNQTLSEERADAVAEVLVAERDDLTVESAGFGEAVPVASNGTDAEDNPAGRAQNRRVEIHHGR